MMTQAALATEPAAPPPLPESVEIKDIDKVRPSATNPRKHNRKPDPDFVDSIRTKGVLQPIVVVVAEGGGGFYDIVFGEMRWAASKLAGRAHIPVIVRDMTPDEVFESQIIENSQRVDPHPLDEADAFAELAKRGYPVQRIADRIGRPLAYVVQRMKLCGLSGACRKALDDETISLGVAVLLAKLPTQKLQDEGLKSITGFRLGDDGQTSVAEARKNLETHVMRALKDAPFKSDDAELVPKAGPCTTCPKRTGTQVELFADASSPDLCTDPQCFRGKVDAVWQIRSKEHKAAGGEVLNQKDAGKLLGHVWDGESAKLRDRFAKLDDRKHLAGKTRTVRSLLGKELPPITLARDPDSGAIVELVSKKDVDAAERKAEGASRSSKPERDTPSAAEKRQREKELAAVEANKRLTAAIVAGVESRTVWKGVEVGLLQGLALCARTAVWGEFTTKATKRRGWDKAPADANATKSKKPAAAYEDEFEAQVMAASPAVLMGLIVELLVARELPGRNREEANTGAALLCMALGVSFESELEAVQKERAAKAGGAKEKPLADKKAKKSKGKGKGKPAATKAKKR